MRCTIKAKLFGKHDFFAQMRSKAAAHPCGNKQKCACAFECDNRESLETSFSAECRLQSTVEYQDGGQLNLSTVRLQLSIGTRQGILLICRQMFTSNSKAKTITDLYSTSFPRFEPCSTNMASWLLGASCRDFRYYATDVNFPVYTAIRVYIRQLSFREFSNLYAYSDLYGN